MRRATVAAAIVGAVASVGLPVAWAANVLAAAFDSAASVESVARRGDQRTVTDLQPVVPGDPVPADDGCPDTPRAAVADKLAQRFWLCADGEPITGARPMTTGGLGYGLPPVGTYHVFAEDRYATGIHGEFLERFVAFYRTPRNNRIAFHEVVNQDPATVGDLDKRGASSGCFRLRESDSMMVWDHLEVGDPVVIFTP